MRPPTPLLSPLSPNKEEGEKKKKKSSRVGLAHQPTRVLCVCNDYGVHDSAPEPKAIPTRRVRRNSRTSTKTPVVKWYKFSMQSNFAFVRQTNAFDRIAARVLFLYSERGSRLYNDTGVSHRPRLPLCALSLPPPTTAFAHTITSYTAHFLHIKRKRT